MKKQIIFSILLILIIISMFDFVSAEINTSDTGYLEVLDALNNTKWVPIITKIYSQNDTIINSILFNLSTSEFKLKGRLSRGFAGNITKAGFEKLVNNPNIKMVYLDRIVPVATGQSLPLIKAGVTPDSIFWGLDKILEKIQLLLTFNVAKKAELRLKIADERLA